ncbi:MULTISPECIES: hypothetical protein [unclassified Saccharopolyspora]|uniref:hypothetical protein n=1 Tax=unclassified Saccharopolyspora TaxID=2646250 RepID=UPI001CD69B4D|nr:MULTISPECIES: hypothetical protein [unclassified Saccharopolyspora]MCA1190009.1 hypothetical protein [Saccharopolyspora sp. 6T]MCA1279720.1 hypothetical protein [Saccharopolyspora sp. 7B]
MNTPTPWWATTLIAILVPLAVAVLTQRRTDRRERLKLDHEQQLRYMDRVLESYSRALFPLEQAYQLLKKSDPDWEAARKSLEDLWDPFQTLNAIAPDDRIVATAALTASAAHQLVGEMDRSDPKSPEMISLLLRFNTHAYNTRKMLREDMLSFSQKVDA